jgi:hypothetical protein
MPGGRPSDYTQETALAICDRLASGESLRKICDDDGMPDQKTVFRWVHSFEEFRQQYARARELQMERWADEIVEISDDGRNDYDGQKTNSDHIARSRLRVDTRKWLMSKLAPKKYGDRMTTTIAGDPENPVKMSLENVTPRDAAKALLFALTDGDDTN